MADKNKVSNAETFFALSCRNETFCLKLFLIRGLVKKCLMTLELKPQFILLGCYVINTPVWCDASLREQKSRHSLAIWKPPKIYSSPIGLTFVSPPNPQIIRCPFQQPFPTHAIFGSLLRSFSHSLILLLSFSLSLSSVYSPLYLYLLPFHINTLMIFRRSIIGSPP
jgi:hypothetical protein